ncbi:hypothetical protein JKF63_04010 [Porcisia hertigi]|uniref:Uncharacterized protein n=1 Tax=Porcisia hertigi TaxID=2761500 RepID=A0A836HRJ0_9TRYP|nr:hypothetical protein JKF63_04010 [Porcisia hertigi]
MEHSGSVRDVTTAAPLKGTLPSNHKARECTPRTEASTDAITGDNQRMGAVTRSASTLCDPKEMLQTAASTPRKDQKKRPDRHEHVGEATHVLSDDLAFEIPVSSPSLKRPRSKQLIETLEGLSDESGDAKLSEIVAVADRLAAHDKSDRASSHRHYHPPSSASQRCAKPLSPSAICDVHSTLDSTSTRLVSSLFPPAVSEGCDERFDGLAARALSPANEGDTYTTPVNDLTTVKATPNNSLSPIERAASSSSESSIIFTVSTAPHEVTTGVHPLKKPHNWAGVPTQTTPLDESRDDTHHSAHQLEGSSRHTSECSPSFSVIQTVVDSASTFGRRSEELSSAAPPVIPLLPSPTHVLNVPEPSGMPQPLERALQGTLESTPDSSARGLVPSATCLSSVNASPVPAQARDTLSVEHVHNASLALGSLSHDSGYAVPLQQPLECDVVESHGSSGQSSFLTIASYNAKKVVRLSSAENADEQESCDGSTWEADPVRYSSSTESVSAAVEARLGDCADQTSIFQVNAQASCDEGVAGAVDAKQELLRHDGASQPWSRVNQDSLVESASSVYGNAVVVESSGGDPNKSAATDASRMIACGSAAVIHTRGFPVPPTNLTHAAAAWEALQRAAIMTGSDNAPIHFERSRGLLGGRVSGSGMEPLQTTVADSLPPYQPRMEGPVWKEPLDSLCLPNLQESSSCCFPAPRGAETLAVAVAAAVKNRVSCAAPGEGMVDNAASLADEKILNAAADAAVPLDTGAALGAGRGRDTNSRLVEKEGAGCEGTDEPSETTAAARSKTSSVFEGAPQSEEAMGATTESSPGHDALLPHLLRPCRSGFAMDKEDRTGATPKGCLSLMLDSALSQLSVDWTQGGQEADDSATDDIKDPPSPAPSPPSHSTVEAHAEAVVAKVESLQSAAILRVAGESASGVYVVKDPATAHLMQKNVQPEGAGIISLSGASVQREDGASNQCRSSSPEVSRTDSAHHVTAMRLGLFLSFSTRSRTPELASVTAPVVFTGSGFSSSHAAELDQSPLELSARAWRAPSFSDGGGEEDVGDGVPQSHAPTPPSSHLSQRKARGTPLLEAAQSLVVAFTEGLTNDSPPIEAFSRTVASARSLSAEATESNATLSLLENSVERFGDTHPVPFSSSVTYSPSADEGGRSGVVGDIALDHTVIPAADVTGEQEALSAQDCHDSPARSPSSPKSCSSRLQAHTPSSPLSHAGASPSTPEGENGAADRSDLSHLFSSTSSSLMTTPPPTPPAKSAPFLNSPGQLDVLHQGGDATFAERKTSSLSPPRDSLEHDVPLHHPKVISTDTAVFLSLCQPPSSDLSSDLQTTRSEISGTIA